MPVTLTSDAYKSAQFHAADDYDRAYQIYISAYTTTGGSFGGAYFPLIPVGLPIPSPVGQIFIDSNSGSLSMASAASTSASFPANSWPLCYVVTDVVGRIVKVINARASAGSPLSGLPTNP